MVDVGGPNDDLRVSLGSAMFFEPPWVPELVETADEVHFSFDVYLPGPGTLTLLGPAQARRRIVSITRWDAMRSR